jgi:iron complex outermembrane recepter protein
MSVSRFVLGLAATTMLAAPAAAWTQSEPAAAEGEDAEIVVYGRGETRQVQELDSSALTILASGTSPLKAIEKLPSVNFQSADPFGNYEWSQRISIRGFNQNQLGYTLDGIPLGDFTYGNHNGLHISRAAAPENIRLTRVSQGAGSIGTNSTNNLGGTLEFFTVDPFDAIGIDAAATYGSENTIRGFGRVNFGSADGARLFLSGVYHDAEKWKGEGSQRNWMVTAKAIVPVGTAEIDAYFNYSDRAEQDYQDLSLEMISRLGYDWDNFGPSNYGSRHWCQSRRHRGDAVQHGSRHYLPRADYQRRRCLFRCLRSA